MREKETPRRSASEGGFRVVPSSATGAVGALRDLFQAVARSDERSPPCFVVGLDCSDATKDSAAADSRKDERDALAVYTDHLLLVRFPGRNAGLGEMVKLLFKSMTGGKAQITPHARFERTELVAVELTDGRPTWGTADEKFVHVTTSQSEVWFWVDLPVDSEDDLRRVVAELNPAASTAEPGLRAE
jgi:hypothetical protein